MWSEKNFQQAITFYNQGKMVEAEKLLLKALESRKNHSESNYVLGLITLNKGQAKNSLTYFKTALDADPHSSCYWIAYIDALDQAGQSDMARTMLETAKLAGLTGKDTELLTKRLQSPPLPAQIPPQSSELKHAGKPNNSPLAQRELDKVIALFQDNKIIECEKLACTLIKQFPNNGFLWKIFGAALKQQNRLEEAITAMKRSVQLSPNDPETLNNLGVTLYAHGVLKESEKILRQAINLDGNYAAFHNNIGISVMAQGRQKEAEGYFRKAIKLQNNYVDAFHNLGICLKNQGKYKEAESNILHAINLAPDNAAGYNNLGNFLQKSNRLYEAQKALQKALELNPSLAKAHFNLGNVYQGLGNIKKSIQCYNNALHCSPDYPEAFDGLLFASNYSTDLSSPELYSLYQEYEKKFGIPHQASWKAHTNTTSANRRLKIGYVSPAFYNHPVVPHLLPLLKHHDKTHFEIYAYAEVTREDQATLSCKNHVEHWIPTIGLSDDELADRIRRDQIDILIDLAGHASQNRLAVFAKKPAPVSLHWLDFGYTTGLSAIDYYLTDFFTAPIGSEGLFSEQLWRLPTPPYTYHPAKNMGPVGLLPAINNGYITFGTLSRAIRLNDRTLNAWVKILEEVKHSKLVIDSSNFKDKASQDAMRNKFITRGIDGDRLLIGFHSPPWDILRTIDIGLDCFPHNSGATLFESLYMGVPYITYAKHPGFGRIGGSILSGIDRYDWIAYSEEEYINKTVTIASDISGLETIRAELRQVVKDSSLMDDQGFTTAVENAYQTMFRKWAETTHSKSNKTFSISQEALHIYNTGIELQTKEQNKEAQNAYVQALNIQPDFVESYNNLGVVFQQMGKFNDAEACFCKALELRPDYTDCYFNLANTYKMQSKLFKAEKFYKRVIFLQPDYPDAHYNLGNILQEQGRIEEAVKQLNHALQLNPENMDAFSTLLYTLNYHPDKSSEEIFASYKAFNNKFCKHLESTWVAHTNNLSPKRRLNIGYVAPGFSKHPARYFLEPLLSHHDKKSFQIFAYININEDAASKDLFYPYADKFVPIKDMDDSELANTIRQHKIDILVDLSGHTAGNRLQCFAMRPAPVSLHWLDFGYTTGLTAIDYYLTDKITAPPNSQKFFSEKLWPIATPALAYRPPGNTGVVNSLPALKNNYITFGTLTRAVRINHTTVRVWSEILKNCPDSKLIINSGSFDETDMQDTFIEKFSEYGIDSNRLMLGCQSPPWDVLRSIDIMLDCFPHNSGTTLIESLYMGVPYITMADRPSMGRLGSSILKGIGHPEWIAATEKKYIKLALSLSSDKKRLSSIRFNLREEVENSPLMDEQHFTNKFEAACKEMFSNWCTNQKHSHSGKKKYKLNSRKMNKRLQKPTAAKIKKLARLFDNGEYQKAVKLAQSLSTQFPSHGFAWKVLGPLLFQQGLIEEGIKAMEQAAHCMPDDADTHYNLGIAFEQSNRLKEAEACYNKTCKINKKHIQAFFNLGNIYKNNEQWTEAENCYRHIIKLKPDSFKTYCNLGLSFKARGKTSDAIDCYQTALKINPLSAEPFNNLSLIYIEQGMLTEAEKMCRKALEINPDLPEAYNNLGLIYQKRNMLTESENFLKHAIELNNNYAAAYCNLGSTQVKKGELEEAELTLRKSIELAPDSTRHFSNLLFLLNNHADKSAEDIFSNYKLFDKQFGDPLKQTWKKFSNDRNSNRRLKIAYIFYNFTAHSTRHFLEPLLAHHNKEKIELYIYTDLLRGDQVTTRYKSYADHWIETKGIKDDVLAEQIRTDKIDILIDIGGHTGENRLLLFAYKPAPVSLHWLDFGYTTGLSAIDYYLTDTTSVPKGSEHLFSEEPWFIRTPALVYRPAENMGETSPLPANKNGYITFGTLTRSLRINHKTIRVWCELLKQVENSHLVIDSGDFKHPDMQEKMIENFTSQGISRERLHVGSHSPPWDLLREIDIGLDCFPHNSGTTLIETLYLGSPFITLADRPSVGRLGSSILHGINHPEWIANTEDEYVQIGVSLASNLPQLSKIRMNLRQEMIKSPLMDEQGFANQVEEAYRQMFHKWAQQEISSTDQSAAQIVLQCLQQAQLCVQSNLLNEAQELFQSILAIVPENPEANFYLGKLFLDKQDAKSAIPYLEQAVNGQPTERTYWLAYIDAMDKSGQHDTACQLLDMAIDAGLDGEDTIALKNRLQGKET